MAHSPAARARRRARFVRYGILLGILALSTTLGLLHAKGSGAWVPVGVDALCPFGGVETLWAYLADGAILQRLAFSTIVLLIATVVVALLMGRAFCGQVCPLGALQEIFGKLGRKLGIARTALPGPLERPARYLKYVVLVVATGATWFAGSLVFRAYDPWAAYHHLSSAELWTEFAIGAAVLGVTVGGSLVYERFFCRYACPMGALLGILGRFSWLKIRRVEDTCTDCGHCDAACPVGLDVSCSSQVSSSDCIACGECVTACHRPGALSFADSAGRVVSPLVITLATVAVFFGVIGVATAADAFDWTKPTVGSEMQRVAEEGGSFDVTVIKGSTTMRQISDGTGIPIETMAQTFGLTAEEYDLPLKDIKDVHGFNMWDVRTYVAVALGVEIPEPESGEAH